MMACCWLKTFIDVNARKIKKNMALKDFIALVLKFKLKLKKL